MIKSIPLVGNSTTSEAAMDVVPGEDTEIGTSAVPPMKISGMSGGMVTAPEATEKTSRSRRKSVKTPSSSEIDESELINRFRAYLDEHDDWFPLSEMEYFVEMVNCATTLLTIRPMKSSWN